MTVTVNEVRAAVRELGLAGLPLCVHSSLRSFGPVDGGAQTVIDGLLAEDCTVLVPAFTDDFDIAPPPGMRPERNSWDYSHDYGLPDRTIEIYTPAMNAINPWMGAIPKAVLEMLGRIRGNHPLNAFAAVGPMATDMVGGQRPDDVYAPLRFLSEAGGYVMLMGVGLNSMTALHLAEQMAGRVLFKRWALGPDGNPMMVDIGSCSEGFPNLDTPLQHLERRTTVGQSTWRIYPLKETLASAVTLIRKNPEITRCAGKCRFTCNDAIAGGPIL